MFAETHNTLAEHQMEPNICVLHQHTAMLPLSVSSPPLTFIDVYRHLSESSVLLVTLEPWADDIRLLNHNIV